MLLYVPVATHGYSPSIYILYIMSSYVYIYILYIMSSGLLITRVSLGQTLQFGRAGQGSVVYKKTRGARV
jgi:hypothetical protein